MNQLKSADIDETNRVEKLFLTAAARKTGKYVIRTREEAYNGKTFRWSFARYGEGVRGRKMFVNTKKEARELCEELAHVFMVNEFTFVST